MAVAAVALARPVDAQLEDSTRGPLVTITPGAHYRAGGFTSLILGTGWRNLWTTPVEAPVLEPARYAGGLEFDRRGGNRQSITVHWKEENGPREFVFRSVDKFPLPSLAPDIQGSLVGRIVQDQTSAFFPASPLLVAPLLRAIGALHVESELLVMEDSPRLGVVRDTVAGMLGTFELKPKDGKDGAAGFAGSRKIEDTDEFFETLRSGHEHRLDERELLAGRLIDLLINDTDRTRDNYLWARFGDEGNYTWRPIARDRDWAFMDSRGLVNSLVISSFYPKFTKFEPRYRMSGLLYSTHVLDRRLLQRLSVDDFREVGLRVQQAVSDGVIARVVEQLPASWRAETSAPERLTSVLRARRDQLLDVAMKFYRDLASDVDIHGTDLADRAEIVRHGDGRVTVRITPLAPTSVTERREAGRIVTTSDGSLEGDVTSDAYYSRTFVAPETKEIRVFLHGGDDAATIRGAPNAAITVRVIGGKGNDVLADSIGAGGAYLYDEEGTNRLIATRKTGVSTRPWNAPEAKAGLRLGQPWRPDWGGSSGISGAVDHHTGAGVVVGARYGIKTYGFRRLPHHLRTGVTLMYGTANGRAALVGDLDYRFENSPLAFTVDARASDIEAIRFFGYGNDTPDVGSNQALVEQRVLAVEPALVYRIGWRARETTLNRIRGEDSALVRGLRPFVGKVRIGPAFSWIDPEPRLEAPLVTSGALGANGFALAGMQLGLELDRTDEDAAPTMGWKLRTLAEAYPVTMDLDGPFGTVMGTASAYLPVAGERGPNVAVRLGGKLGAGDVPVQFAPIVGGRSTLRGFPSRRFTGDAAAHAGVELRQPVGTLNFLLRSRVGLFALADAGRVWFDGDNSGGWHTGVGGGFWLSTLGRSLSVAYAHGETHRVYLKAGLSY